MLTGRALLVALVTLVCSCLSLSGSLLIMVSYFVARSKSTPKSAFLIMHLAFSDFVWFLSSSTMSAVWLGNNGDVPPGLCYIAAPCIVFTRMASLVWTCVISFNVLMSVRKRKWFWKSQEEDWESYRKLYFCIIFIWAFPSTLLTMVSQYSANPGDPLGCAVLSESLGAWYIIFFTEMLPIFCAFVFNVYVFFKVHRRMSKSAVPQSVRNKRKRVMYHYIILCLLCWMPMVVLEFFQIVGEEPFVLDVVARTALYISGFLNFLVFGMQDPHLKRSMEVVLYRLGLGHVAAFLGLSAQPHRVYLKAGDVDKMVMFQEETLISNADQAKDRFSIYRNRKLSKEDKADLYEQRPDLDPKFQVAVDKKNKAGTPAVPRKSAMKKSTQASNSNTATSTSPATRPEANFRSTDSEGLDVPLLHGEGAEEVAGTAHVSAPVTTERTSLTGLVGSIARSIGGTGSSPVTQLLFPSSANNNNSSSAERSGADSPGRAQQVSNDHVQMASRRHESAASNNSLTAHDLSTLSNLAFSASDEERAVLAALQQSGSGARAVSGSGRGSINPLLGSVGSQESKSSGDIERGSSDGSDRGGDEDEEDSSDDEIDEEDEYLMQPPSQ